MIYNDKQILNYTTLKETPNSTKFHYNTKEKIEDSSMTPRSGNNAEHMVLSSDKPSTNNIILHNDNNMQVPIQPIEPIYN